MMSSTARKPLLSQEDKQDDQRTEQGPEATGYNARLLATMVLVGGGFMFTTGYQQTNVNEPQHLFMEWLSNVTNGTMQESRLVALWSFIVSIRLVGNVLGAACGSLLADYMGRRNALILITVPLISGDLLSFLSHRLHSFYPLLFGRLVSGMADGACRNCLVVFFTEISPTKLRGRVGVFTMILREAGMIVGVFVGLPEMLGTPARIFHIFLFSLFLTLPVPFYLFCFPESPRYLYITRSDAEQARISLRFYQGKDCDVAAVLNGFEKVAQDQKVPGRIGIWAVLCSRRYRMPVLLALCFGSSFGFAGRSVLQNYSTAMIQHSGLTLHAAQRVAMLIQLLPVPVSLLGMLVVDRFGRRPMLISAATLTMLCELLTMLLFFARGSSTETNALTYLIVTCIALWCPIMIGGLMCLSFVPSELFPQNMRSSGFTLHMFCWFSVGALTAQVFNVLLSENPALAVLFLLVPFALISVVLMIFLPETKNRSIEAIYQQMRSLPLGSIGTTAFRMQGVQQMKAAPSIDLGEDRDSDFEDWESSDSK